MTLISVMVSQMFAYVEINCTLVKYALIKGVSFVLEENHWFVGLYFASSGRVFFREKKSK